MTELVFALVLRRLWIHQAVSRVARGSAGLACAAVAAFIVAAEPSEGSATPTSSAWGAPILVSAVPASGPVRVGVGRGLGTRSDIHPGHDRTLTADGIGGMFAQWPVYAVVAAGSSACPRPVGPARRPLRLSQSLLVIVDPLASIVLSVYLFGDTSLRARDHWPSRPSFGAMCVGGVPLTRPVPERTEREHRRPRCLSTGCAGLRVDARRNEVVRASSCPVGHDPFRPSCLKDDDGIVGVGTRGSHFDVGIGPAART